MGKIFFFPNKFPNKKLDVSKIEIIKIKYKKSKLLK